jgi:hypothetical protein
MYCIGGAGLGGIAANKANAVYYSSLPPQSLNSVVVPTSVNYYIPITLTNQQSVAVSANTPLSFVFNALAYQTYESNTLNNIELFYANGTVANSWMEGNYLNEQQQPNTLRSSNTVMYWFKSPNGFLPANTGTATTN